VYKRQISRARLSSEVDKVASHVLVGLLKFFGYNDA